MRSSAGAPRALRGRERPRDFHRCSCGRPIPEDVRRCSARTCPEFAPTWARDTRRRLLENLRLVKLSVMFSATAPGAELSVRPPVLFALARPGMLRPSRLSRGSGGCCNLHRHAGEWWSELHRAAKVRADRATGLNGTLAARVWEKQKRGLAHVHGVIAVESPAQVRWAQAYVIALRQLAPRYGFGFVDGWHKVGRKLWPGVQAAAYLSSYFAGGRGRKMAITENVLAGDLPRLVVFIGRDLTSRTGCTMRNLRGARRLWASREWQVDRPQFTYTEWLAAAAMLQPQPCQTRGP